MPQPPLYLPPPMLLTPPTISYQVRAILAVLLSLKKRPVIRWERMSQAGRKLAMEVQVCWAYERRKDEREWTVS